AVSVRAPLPYGSGFSWFKDVDSDMSLARKLDDAGTELLQWIQTPPPPATTQSLGLFRRENPNNCGFAGVPGGMRRSSA
ncbi:MAG: hypothetical protein JWQ59_213, partial [Cryobacterium sp.]|nr:hypothetical protein [Cryobacterium sp.]